MTDDFESIETWIFDGYQHATSTGDALARAQERLRDHHRLMLDTSIPTRLFIAMLAQDSLYDSTFINHFVDGVVLSYKHTTGESRDEVFTRAFAEIVAWANVHQISSVKMGGILGFRIEDYLFVEHRVKFIEAYAEAGVLPWFAAGVCDLELIEKLRASDVDPQLAVTIADVT